MTGITVDGGIEIGGGITFVTIPPGPYAGQSTIGSQNVAGSDGDVGFFFRPNDPLFGQISAGWLVNGMLGAVVVSASSDMNDQYTTAVTITGGTFLSGSSYSFTGI